jgi:hypothetical protein
MQTHTNYAVARAAILSKSDACFSRKMASAGLKPLQMAVRCVAIETNYNLTGYFQFKIRTNETVQ